MGKRLFTADWHLGSTLVWKCEHRPGKDALDAGIALAGMCNGMARPEDTVVHVGDFILAGHDRHSGFDDDATGMPSQDEWLRKLEPSFFLVEGNHDNGHNGVAAAKCLLLDLSRSFRNVTVGHFPSCSKSYAGLYGSKHRPHLHLCGHVHGKWKAFYDSKACVLDVNVGVDVWDFKLVSGAEIAQLAELVLRHCSLERSFKLTASECKKLARDAREASRLAAKMRKAEKHARKGLTPEECKRRRDAAMAAKGLLQHSV